MEATLLETKCNILYADIYVGEKYICGRNTTAFCNRKLFIPLL